MTPITGISTTSLAQAGGLAKAGAAALPEQSFQQFLTESLSEVNSLQADADLAVQQLVTGGEVNPAEVFTAVQKADMSFKLMMQIRNKLVQAYQEINNIRI